MNAEVISYDELTVIATAFKSILVASGFTDSSISITPLRDGLSIIIILNDLPIKG